MRQAVEIAFFCFLILLSHQIGLIVTGLLKAKSGDSFAIRSAAGVAAIATTVTISYKLGIPLSFFFTIVTAVAVLSMIPLFFRRTKPALHAGYMSAVLLPVIVGVGIILPALVGGPRFSLFQGNHHDTYNYLESALSFRDASYQTLENENPTAMTSRGLFAFTTTMIHIRPTICIFYAMLSDFFPSAFLDLHYIMLAYFQLLSVMLLAEIVKVLVPKQPLLGFLTGTGIAGGFWGQYIVDINAWSQSAFMPSLLALILLMMKFASSWEESRATFVPWADCCLFALVGVGAFYFYPEGCFAVLPGLLAGGVFSIVFCRVRIRLISFLTIASVGGWLIYVIRENNINYMMNQVAFALSKPVDWWHFFGIYLFGHDGWNTGLFANATDFLAGVLGLYFLTPGSDWPAVLALSVRLFLCLLISLSVIGATRYYRVLSRGARSVLFSFFFVCSIETLWLVMRAQYWTAGKALSVFAYFLLILFYAPNLQLYTPNPRSLFSIRNAWTCLHFVAALFLLSSEVLLIPYRVVAAQRPYGIHYAMPYPAIQSPLLKQSIDYSDWSCLHSLRPNDFVGVSISEPWIQFFTRMLLESNKVTFCVLPPVYLFSSVAEKERESDTIPEYSHPDVTCTVVLKVANRGQFTYRLAVVRPAEAGSSTFEPVQGP